MGRHRNGPPKNLRQPADQEDVERCEYGAVAEILLANRLKLTPRQIWLLHTYTLPAERSPFGSEFEAETAPTPYLDICVWVRIAWPDGTETLGFVSVSDGDAIGARWPKCSLWLSRFVTPERRPVSAAAAYKRKSRAKRRGLLATHETH